jgi:uncharacterized protein YukE
MARYDMGQSTLSTLRQQTGTNNQDLGALVKRLVAAAAPLEGRFNGAGKVAFDNFKAHAEQISANLNSSLASILHGQAGMDTSFVSGEQEMVDTTRSTQGAADFGAATLGGQ